MRAWCSYRLQLNTVVPLRPYTKLRNLGLNLSLCSWILDYLSDLWQVVLYSCPTDPQNRQRCTPSSEFCGLAVLVVSLYSRVDEGKDPPCAKPEERLRNEDQNCSPNEYRSPSGQVVEDNLSQ